MIQVSDNVKPQKPPSVSSYPTWFARWPLAPWGWWELNVFGWPLMLAILGLALLGGAWQWLIALPAAMLAFLLYFFRDPPRKIPTLPEAIVSPADGTVMEVAQIEHDDFVGGPAVRISIFLSLLNVHVNRAPLSARVVALDYSPGEFLNAQRPESAERNERMWIGFEEADAPHRRFAVRQISGMLARRIVCTLEPNQAVTRGEKFGMIKFGSRTELVLPADAVQIEVQPRDRVRAGSQVVAHWK